jgi:hypothetical protein
MRPVVDDKLLTRYLLGQLSEPEQAQVEEQLFADAACYDRLCALKAELTDQYVRGEMSTREQQIFATRFLTTKDGREDELFARALDVVLQEERAVLSPADTSAATAPSKSEVWREKLASYFRPFPLWQMATMAAAALLAAGVIYLLLETQRLRQQLAGVQTEVLQAERTEAELSEELRRARSRNEELNQVARAAQQERDQARQELERLSARSPSGTGLATMLSLILAPGAGRGGAQVDELSLPPQTQRVQLLLLLSPGETQPAYRAEIRTKQGDLIHTKNQLPSRRTKDGKALQLTIPAHRLKTGSYEVSLFGVQPNQTPEVVNYYDFKITQGR